MSLLDIENCFLFDALSKCAANLAYNSFKWDYPTLLYFNATILCGVNVFMKTYNNNVITGQHIHSSLLIENTAQFVLFVTDNDDISNKLESLKMKNFNNAGKFIFVCNSIGIDRCNEEKAVKIFWQYRIGNVILIKYDEKNKATGFTYYMNSHCGPGRPHKLMYWDSCIEKNSPINCAKHMFPLKFKNFHRCPLYVTTFVQDPYMFLNRGVVTGADGDLLCIIMSALNATLIIVNPKRGNGWGNLEKNGTWTGSFGDIYDDRANFSMTSASITSQRYQHFQMSRYYNTILVGWVTRPADFEPSSYKLLKPFGFRAWCFISTILALMVLSALCLPIFLWKSSSKRYRISSNIVTSVMQVCVGLPLNKFPTTWFLKYLVLIWIWYYYILRALYQVNLIIFLQTDVRTRNVLTIEEAIREGYSFGGGPALKYYFADEPYIYENWIDVESSEITQTMNELAQGRKFVLAMNLATASRFLFSNPNKKLHVLPKKIVSCPSVLFFKKYSMMEQSISQILTKLFEAGISDHLLENFISNKQEYDEDVIQSIKLEHLHGCFGLLLTGWTVSIIIAIAEKIVYKI